MRYVVIFVICASCELALLGAAILAGAPVGAFVRGAARRGANAVIICTFALGAWVAAGLGIHAIVAALPDGGRFATGIVQIGDTDFNLAILVPMIAVSFAIAALLMPSLAAAGRGRALGACLRAATRISAR